MSEQHALIITRTLTATFVVPMSAYPSDLTPEQAIAYEDNLPEADKIETVISAAEDGPVTFTETIELRTVKEPADGAALE